MEPVDGHRSSGQWGRWVRCPRKKAKWELKIWEPSACMGVDEITWEGKGWSERERTQESHTYS